MANVNHEQALIAGGKKCPYWSPAIQSSYPFRKWLQDVVWWSLGTDSPAERQGPQVILSLGGVAREMCNELDPGVVQNGDWRNDDHGGQVWFSGLQIILRGLARHYAPLDGENSIRSIAEVMAFKILPGEDIDAVLSRFSVLRLRAENEAQLNPGVSGWAWMLLTGMCIPPDEWTELLQHNGGRLPETDAELQALFLLIRRRGHLYRSDGIMRAAQQAVHTQGVQQTLNQRWQPGRAHGGQQYHHGFDASMPMHDTGGGAYPAFAYPAACAWPASSAYPAMHASASAWSQYDPNSVPESSPQFDPSYQAWDDESVSSATEYDGLDSYDPEDLNTYLADVPEPMHGDVLLYDFLVARRRWRTWSKKPTRGFRRSSRKGKGKGDRGRGKAAGRGMLGVGKGHHYGDGQVDPSAWWESYAMGKGKGGKSGGARKNPCGKDGKTMLCHGCDSEYHLIKDCPNPKRPGHTGKGFGFTTDAGPEPAPTPASQNMFVFSGFDAATAQPGNGLEQMYAGLDSVAPGPMPSPGVHFERVVRETRETCSFGTIDEMLSRNFSSPPSPDARASAPASSSTQDNVRTRAPLPSQSDDAPGTAPSIGESLSPFLTKSKHTHTSLFFPTFSHEVQVALKQYQDIVGRYDLTAPDSKSVEFGYHLQARIPGKECVLLDPGAHSGLIGDRTADRMNQAIKQYGRQADYKPLKQPRPVGGVGAGIQTCTQRVLMPIAPDGQFESVYDACVVPNSDLPGLCGNDVMIRNRAIMNIADEEIWFCGPGPIKIVAPPGSVRMDMQLSRSGHWMLPVSDFHKLPPPRPNSKPDWMLHSNDDQS